MAIQAEQLSFSHFGNKTYADARSFADELREFKDFDTATRVESHADSNIDLPVFINEFWTSKQRAAELPARDIIQGLL